MKTSLTYIVEGRGPYPYRVKDRATNKVLNSFRKYADACEFAFSVSQRNYNRKQPADIKKAL